MLKNSIKFRDNNKGTIIINGERFEGNSVTWDNNTLVIDGVSQALGTNVSISLIGDCDYISTTSGSITVNGRANSVITTSGSITVSETVVGDASSISGSIKAETIVGSVSTVSGSIKGK